MIYYSYSTIHLHCYRIYNNKNLTESNHDEFPFLFWHYEITVMNSKCIYDPSSIATGNFIILSLISFSTVIC